MPVIVEAATADTTAGTDVTPAQVETADADTDSAVKIVDTTAETAVEADTRIQLETERANKPPRIVQNAFISAFGLFIP